MTIFEAVMKLTGPIAATGDFQTDIRRLENLNQAIRVADLLLGEIKHVALESVRTRVGDLSFGKRAKTFLDGVREGKF